MVAASDSRPDLVAVQPHLGRDIPWFIGRCRADTGNVWIWVSLLMSGAEGGNLSLKRPDPFGQPSTASYEDQRNEVWKLIAEAARGQLARMNAEVVRLTQLEYLETTERFSSADINRFSGASASNVAEPATRWRRQGLIFGIQWGGAYWYPAFQFHNGNPRPLIKAILELLPTHWDDWDVGFWFWASNEHFETPISPQDALDETDAVLKAAKATTDTLVGK